MEYDLVISVQGESYMIINMFEMGYAPKFASLFRKWWYTRRYAGTLLSEKPIPLFGNFIISQMVI